MPELRVEERTPPSSVAQEAKSIATQGTAGRVKVEPYNSGWRVKVDGRTEQGVGPPTDIPFREWDDSPGLSQKEFQNWADEVKNRASNRKQITTNHSRSQSPGHWRITLNYDDPRRSE